MARISTSSSGGLVGIQDTNGNPLLSTGGALDVNVVSTGSSGTTIAQYAEADTVAMGSSVDILTYTVPVGKTLSLSRVNVSSTSVSSFEINIAGSTSGIMRLSYGGQYNSTFNYEGFSISAGTVVIIRGSNFSQNDLATFNVTMIGSLV